MACSGGHCNSHNTGTTTCSGHRSSCSTNRNVSSPSVGAEITANMINSLRVAIRNEVSRWNSHSLYNASLNSAGSISVSSRIQSGTINNLDNMVHGVFGVSGGDLSKWSSLVDDLVKSRGDEALYNDYRRLKVQYDIVRQNCICNSDCSCNAVCGCHNNCGCNYSDKKLKKFIKYC